MKKTMKMMLALMAGAMAFTACSSDDILENIENNEVVENASQLKPMTFTAVQEGQGGTRATIDGFDIKWTVGDKISIFDGASENDGDQMFTLATGEGTTSATFTGSAAPAATYYALYPYAESTALHAVTKAEADAAAGNTYRADMWKDQYEHCYDDQERENTLRDIKEYEMHGISEENQAIILAYVKGEDITVPGAQLDGSSIKNVVIPAEQTATAGSADPTAMIMVAKGDDKDALQFKNVCAYVKVTPQFDCTAICLKSNGTENLAGKVDINYNAGEPTTTVTADGTNSVMLVGTITTGNAYYIAVRPEALSSGFTIEFLTADKNTYYARSTNNALALARSNVKNLGEFATSGTWTITSPTSGDDGNCHSWKLITPTIKLATSCAYDVNSDDGARFGDVSTTYSWGSGWVLPTADDFQYLWANKLFVFNDDYIKLRGEGVLKYVGDFDVFVSYWGRFWTSTPGAASNTQKEFYPYDGTCWDQDINDSWSTSNIIYKYNN